MRRYSCAFLLTAVWVFPIHARGLLIPEDKNLPPLAMVNHRVAVTIEDQVAVTRIEQVFRNHTDRALEATYVFPIPKGASVNKFSMVVNGKDMGGELLKADDARKVYTDIVRRTQDPGLLEYIGNNLMRLRVFPVPARADQKVTLSFNAVINSEGGVVEYVYPLKTDGKATRTLEEFSVKATIKSQHKVQNIYSPTHAIAVKKVSDQESQVEFERSQATLDKDFQLFFTTGHKDIGLTPMFHRPLSAEGGYFLMLISPNVEQSASNIVPRDLVLVLDTSGSMSGIKMDQAKKAVKYCLDHLNPQDRFGLMNFSTTVNRYRDTLQEVNSERIDHAKNWVSNLKQSGGTAIQDALTAALEMRSTDENRAFQIVFFTDGQPTIGETNPDKILKNIGAKNSANTRIFTFGVGDDVNATMLDQLADQTRAVSSFVREAEDIEVKVSSLYSKVSHPVLANLRLTTGEGVRLEEIYPPQLPDLFHGGQLVVLGRFTGQGPAAIRLSGIMGKEAREFVYETNFPVKTGEEKEFVEHIWARRKVGFLLDQVRVNGEKKELMDELLTLAKKYAIATPFTSHLIVPDAPMPVAGGSIAASGGGIPGGGGFGGFGPMGPGGLPGAPPGLAPHDPRSSVKTVNDFAREFQKKPGDANGRRGGYEDRRLKTEADSLAKNAAPAAKEMAEGLRRALEQKGAYDQARDQFARQNWRGTQTGKLGVDLSVANNTLRNQERLSAMANVQCNGRNCVELGGVWIDEGFDPAMACVTVKAQSDAYFRILERHPKMKNVFRLGNHLVWVTPNKSALVIDTSEGKEKLTDEEIDSLFVARK